MFSLHPPFEDIFEQLYGRPVISNAVNVSQYEKRSGCTVYRHGEPIISVIVNNLHEKVFIGFHEYRIMWTQSQEVLMRAPIRFTSTLVIFVMSKVSTPMYKCTNERKVNEFSRGDIQILDVGKLMSAQILIRKFT